jgi:hypothetical protein
MAHDYDVPLRFLAVTITRDNEVAPGGRLPDKHSRLFCGKTLDEWCALQVWSSEYAGRHVFVAETEEHAKKLQYLKDKYAVMVYVRPRDMLHPLNDSGAVPLHWATQLALSDEFHTLITHPFVVSPCRPPGFFDRMVEEYKKMMLAPEWSRVQLWVMAGHPSPMAMFRVDEHGVGTQLGEDYTNENHAWRLSCCSHWLALSHWWLGYYAGVIAQTNTKVHPTLFDIEPWMDTHIDNQEQWELCEYWFAKKILSQGEDCYERYRQSWVK